jgi:hypothetical protein
MLPIQLMLAFTPAWADLAPDPDCSELEDGDACFTTDGASGTCDAGECVASAEDDSGCSTLSATAAGGTTVLALGLLAVGRRRD